MRRLLFSSVSFVVFVLAFNSTAQSLPTVGGDAIVKSKYIFRGAEFNDKPVFQPDLWVNWKGFTATFCSSVNLDRSSLYPDDGAGDITDKDYILDYTKAVGKWTLKGGYAYYQYTGYNGFPSTGEIYQNVGYDFGILQAVFAAYEDVNYLGTESVYLNTCLARTFVIDKVSLSTSAWAGYGTEEHNLYYYGVEKDAITDVGAKIGLGYALPEKLAKHMALSVDFAATQLVDDDLRNAARHDGLNFIFGLNLNLTFPPPETK